MISLRVKLLFFMMWCSVQFFKSSVMRDGRLIAPYHEVFPAFVKHLMPLSHI